MRVEIYALSNISIMTKFRFKQVIQQLEKRKGGYFYLRVAADIVNQFEKKKATRLLCTLDDQITLQCGLNSYGDGSFYIIIATRHINALQKNLGDEISFEITEDPNPLGVEMPEVLEALIEQDEDAKSIFDKLTDGKKRSLIYTINRVKNIDRKVELSLEFLEKEAEKQRRSTRKS